MVAVASMHRPRKYNFLTAGGSAVCTETDVITAAVVGCALVLECWTDCKFAIQICKFYFVFFSESLTYISLYLKVVPLCYL